MGSNEKYFEKQAAVFWLFSRMFLMLEFWASSFSDTSFLFIDSVKHLKLPVGSTQVCPWFVSNSLLVQEGQWIWAQPNQGQTYVLPTGILRCFTESGNTNQQSEKGLAQNSNFINILLFICLHRARSGTTYSCLIDWSVLTSFLILIQNVTKELLRRLIWN